MEPLEKLGVSITAVGVILGVCFQNLNVIVCSGFLLLAIILGSKGGK